ncbi:succinylglutamate desuccinylase/aspartoacylase family protein [Halomonas garicola]|uniref:succinylglutamate desuccinylase/aspartoacylase family protein n=1 Tax=Halomonas garicola TaxID=1690008 RepID=UPI00289FE4ED|nr:succinylglutamate desuccinylase/aspartoacylase family protein [Halomonas garicola]
MTSTPSPARAPFQLGRESVAPGTRRQIDVPVARLYTHTPLNVPVEVVHGRREGPVLLVCGGIHGDEINGVEIVRRLLHVKAIAALRGTLIAVPVVNVFGFLQQIRYLPDRRDLNRCFPGSESGSLGGRIAALFCEQVVDHATPVLTYEAGEALRFDEWAIAPGVSGVLRVMRRLGMLTAAQRRRPASAEVANGSSWARAPIDGILRPGVRLGARVAKGDLLGWVAGPFGNNPGEVKAVADGIVIGMTRLPLVNEGEALFHIARFDAIDEAETAVESFQSLLTLPPAL